MVVVFTIIRLVYEATTSLTRFCLIRCLGILPIICLILRIVLESFMNRTMRLCWLVLFVDFLIGGSHLLAPAVGCLAFYLVPSSWFMNRAFVFRVVLLLLELLSRVWLTLVECLFSTPRCIFRPFRVQALIRLSWIGVLDPIVVVVLAIIVVFSAVVIVVFSIVFLPFIVGIHILSATATGCLGSPLFIRFFLSCLLPLRLLPWCWLVWKLSLPLISLLLWQLLVLLAVVISSVLVLTFHF